VSYYTQETLPVYYKYEDKQVLVGDDGHFYNSNGERVYYWVASGEMPEKGSSHDAGLYGQVSNDDRFAKNISTHAQGAAGFYTENEIKQAFHADEGMTTLSSEVSWDNYWGYLQEQQSLVETGQLSTALDAWHKDSRQAQKDFLQANGGLRAMGGVKGGGLGQIRTGGYRSSFDATLNSEAQQGLMEKWGIPTQVQTDDGSLYRFNGSSLTKVYEAPGTDLAKTAAQIATGVALSAALGPAVGAKVGGGMLGSAAGAAAANAATQGVLTGSIDPKSVLAAGVIGGINPGQYVAGKVGDALGMSATGQPFNPDSFGYGAISGAGNAAVSQAITDGSLDGAGILQAGLLSGAANSIRDAIHDSEYYSQEAIAERLIQQGYSPEDAWYRAGNDPNLFKGKSDLGALVGEGGLFSFLPEVPVGPVAGLLDTLSGGTSTFYRYPDKDQTEIPAYLMDDDAITRAYNAGAVEVVENSIGLLSNPIVNTAGKVLGQVLGTPTMSEKDKAIYDAYRGQAEAEAQDAIGAEGWKNLDGVAKEALITQNQQELYRGYLASWHGSDGLDEKYTIAPNPRGDADIIGSALVSIDPETGKPKYTTGMRYDDQLADGTPITTALNVPKLPDSPTSSNVIVNLSGDNQATLPAGANGQDFLNYLLADSIINGTFASGNKGGGSDLSGDFIGTGMLTDLDTDSSVSTNNDNNTNTPSTNTPSTNNTNTNSTTADPVTEGVVSGGGATAPESEVTPIYGLSVNDDGTATLPGGATVPASVADSIYEQTYLPSDYELAGGGGTLPSGGGGGGGGDGLLSSANGNGLPLLWSELYGYSKITPYKGARLKILNDIVSGLSGQGMMTPKIDNEPYMKLNRDLIDAGILA